MTSFFSYLGRTLRTLVLTLTYGMLFLVGGSRRPELLRMYFVLCGGAFVKFGQLLAMRYDLLPKPYTEALANLLDTRQPERLGGRDAAMLEATA